MANEYQRVALEESAAHDGDADEMPSYPPRKLTVAALSLGLRRHRGTIKIAIACVLLIPLTLYILVAYAASSNTAFMPDALQEARSVLLVVAHPDDECLFFSPAMTSLLRRGRNQPEGHILVMSSGNHYGLGDQRRLELQGSCNQLGVKTENCVVLNQVDIQDDPIKWWPEERIDEIVNQYIKQWQIDLIVTFDSGGVSGHVNHRAVSAALVRLVQTLPSTPPVYLSKTVFVLRKYSVILDFPFSLLPFLPRLLQRNPSASKALLVSDWSAYVAGRRAFKSHASQLVWDRWLYMVLSRYMYWVRLDLVPKLS